MWFVNPPIVEWHRQRFPEHADRFHVVENGWDAGVVDAAAIAPAAHSPLRAGYVGLVPTNFPMTPVLNAWERVAAAHDDLAPLRFIGPPGVFAGLRVVATRRAGHR